MESYRFKTFTPYDQLTTIEMDALVQFLFDHLDQYGDARADITRAIEYAVKISPSPGGFIVQLMDQRKIIGAVVVNQTGMKGYIPENILVYIAVDANYRGQGLGKKLMQKAIDLAKGDIALHVEPDNPALYLYEKMGFENKYLEMRLKKQPNTTSKKHAAATSEQE